VSVARLYLVTRADLSPAQQAVQAAHAALDWALAWPDLHAAWARGSNTLALLAVRDEAALYEIGRRARQAGIASTAFREPDLGGALTAIALAPGPEAERLCRKLELALRVPGAEPVVRPDCRISSP